MGPQKSDWKNQASVPKIVTIIFRSLNQVLITILKNKIYLTDSTSEANDVMKHWILKSNLGDILMNNLY